MTKYLTIIYIIIYVCLGADNPTYLKEPSDKFYFAFGMGALTVGVLSILKGLHSMMLGINKE